MAKHNDINRASSLLEGSQGWIIENHPEAIRNPHQKAKRRSRKKCIHYCAGGLCDHAIAECMGVDCGSYYEK